MTFTYKDLTSAMEYATDHALLAYRDDYMDYDGDDLDYIWSVLQIHVIDEMHTPVHLDPSTSPNGEKNKYMVAPNMVAALIHTPDGPVVKSIMTPTYRQRKWMECN